MDHSEAVQEMATERYLLDELTPELREAFEEHVFDCPECAFDLRATAAFVEQAKTLLPELTASAAPAPVSSASAPSVSGRPLAKPMLEKRDWLAWCRPLFANPLIAGPVFAALLLVVGYQNLVVYPALRSQATEPRAVQLVALHAATRASEPKAIQVSRRGELALSIDLPQDLTYTSYAFELYDAQGKALWSKGVLEMALTGAGDGTLSVAVPGSGLRQGPSSLVVYGLSAHGQRVEAERFALDIQLTD